MTTSTILTILFGLLSAGSIFLSYYFSIKAKLQEAVEDAINMAEELDMIGAEKLNAATEQVYILVPAALKPFLNKELIKQLVQFTFDHMKEFAIKQEKQVK